MKFSRIVLSALALSLLLPGCSKDRPQSTRVTAAAESAAMETNPLDIPEPSEDPVLLPPRSQDLIGIWEFSYTAAEIGDTQSDPNARFVMQLVLDEDGSWDTHTYDAEGTLVPHYDDLGTFTAENGILTLDRTYNDPMEFPYEQVGREILILHGEDLSMEFSRNPEDLYYLIGDWECSMTAEDAELEGFDSDAEVKLFLSINEDGTYQMHSLLPDGTDTIDLCNSYNLSGDSITLDAPDTPSFILVYNFVLNKDSLVLTDFYSSYELCFTRSK